jgi:hypothetical protein
VYFVELGRPKTTHGSIKRRSNIIYSPCLSSASSLLHFTSHAISLTNDYFNIDHAVINCNVSNIIQHPVTTMLNKHGQIELEYKVYLGTTYEMHAEWFEAFAMYTIHIQSNFPIRLHMICGRFWERRHYTFYSRKCSQKIAFHWSSQTFSNYFCPSFHQFHSFEHPWFQFLPNDILIKKQAVYANLLHNVCLKWTAKPTFQETSSFKQVKRKNLRVKFIL